MPREAGEAGWDMRRVDWAVRSARRQRDLQGRDKEGGRGGKGRVLKSIESEVREGRERCHFGRGNSHLHSDGMVIEVKQAVGIDAFVGSSSSFSQLPLWA